MGRSKTIIKNSIIMMTILLLVLMTSLVIQNISNAQSLVTPLFVLAVFLVSRFTDGYLYGLCAALISVLAVNYTFSFPYFAFDFTILENIVSAAILIIVTVATSTMTTKIKEQERARLKAEKEKIRADLLRAVSHDLRTPLTTIYGVASTIIENYDSISEKQKVEMLKGMQEDSKWLIRMVENLLSITKIDNNINLTKNEIVLEELIDAVLLKFNKSYPNQLVELEMPEDFIMVSADPLLVEQVLTNFLENTVYHAEGMTELKLKVYAAEKQVFFEVIDNGKGIDKEHLKNIFTNYYMNDETIKDNQKKCMGIGLSVCAAIIRAHGQEIYARNIPGGGMLFGFSLEQVEE